MLNLLKEDILLAIHKEDSHVNDYFKTKMITKHNHRRYLASSDPEGIVCAKRACNLRDISIAICHKASFEPDIVYETPSCENITEMILQDIGLGLCLEGRLKLILLTAGRGIIGFSTMISSQTLCWLIGRVLYLVRLKRFY